MGLAETGTVKNPTVIPSAAEESSAAKQPTASQGAFWPQSTACAGEDYTASHGMTGGGRGGGGGPGLAGGPGAGWGGIGGVS
jgi:hypothetical protein